MHFTPELRFLGISSLSQRALFIAFEHIFDRPKRARNHYAMLKCSFGYLRISPLFWAIRFGWRTHIGWYSLDTLLLSVGLKGITLLLCAELSLDTLLLSAGLKGITLLLCTELGLDTLLLSTGLKGITPSGKNIYIHSFLMGYVPLSSFVQNLVALIALSCGW